MSLPDSLAHPLTYLYTEIWIGVEGCVYVCVSGGGGGAGGGAYWEWRMKRHYGEGYCHRERFTFTSVRGMAKERQLLFLKST